MGSIVKFIIVVFIAAAIIGSCSSGISNDGTDSSAPVSTEQSAATEKNAGKKGKSKKKNTKKNKKKNKKNTENNTDSKTNTEEGSTSTFEATYDLSECLGVKMKDVCKAYKYPWEKGTTEIYLEEDGEAKADVIDMAGQNIASMVVIQDTVDLTNYHIHGITYGMPRAQVERRIPLGFQLVEGNILESEGYDVTYYSSSRDEYICIDYEYEDGDYVYGVAGLIGSSFGTMLEGAFEDVEEEYNMDEWW